MMIYEEKTLNIYFSLIVRFTIRFQDDIYLTFINVFYSYICSIILRFIIRF